MSTHPIGDDHEAAAVRSQSLLFGSRKDCEILVFAPNQPYVGFLSNPDEQPVGTIDRGQRSRSILGHQ